MADHFNACFISHRHPAAENSREARLIGHVVKAVTDHVQLYTHEHEVYFDKERLVPGYQYNDRLADAICRSACMVIVYWPAYLESDYCKKEMAAMLEIEEKRRVLLGSALHGCRLFIPVILRGHFEELPNAVRNGCQYLNYRAQSTRPDFNIGDDEKMSAELFRVAEYIKSLCDKMKTARDALFGGCGEYGFPKSPSQTHGPIDPAPPQPFPGH